jgi:hypothetical protein
MNAISGSMINNAASYFLAMPSRTATLPGSVMSTTTARIRSRFALAASRRGRTTISRWSSAVTMRTTRPVRETWAARSYRMVLFPVFGSPVRIVGIAMGIRPAHNHRMGFA